MSQKSTHLWVHPRLVRSGPDHYTSGPQEDLLQYHYCWPCPSPACSGKTYYFSAHVSAGTSLGCTADLGLQPVNEKKARCFERPIPKTGRNGSTRLTEGSLALRRERPRSGSFRAENILRHGDGRNCVCPSRVERKMSDDLREFSRLHDIVQRQQEAKWHLNGLNMGYECCDRHNAAATRRKLRRFERPSKCGPFV